MLAYVASVAGGDLGKPNGTVAVRLNIGLELLRKPTAGRGGILLVEGEPGIGKSRILRELSDAAARHRFSLVCDAADKPLDQLRDGLSRSSCRQLVRPAAAGPVRRGRPGRWRA